MVEIYFFSDDIAGNIEKAEMIFMAVNTPTKTEGEGAGMKADPSILKHVQRILQGIQKKIKSLLKNLPFLLKLQKR